MKIVRFSADNRIEYGILDGEVIKSIEDISHGHEQIQLTDRHYNLNEVQLLSPCTPSKIVAVGLNYYSHAQEMKMPIPDNPIIFLKPSTSVIGPEDNIIYPDSSERVDYEAELAVVIKARARRVPKEKAMDYILGYTCCNDVTARDLQRSDKLWTRAKGFDTFAAIGPHIETDLDPSNVNVESYLNGELKQQGNSEDLISPVPELIEYISGIMTLLPGDVIATGTPSGIGPMKPGDKIEIKLKGIGMLRNYVVKNG